MSKKVSLVLFFVVLFGLVATTSVFARPRPGIWDNTAAHFGYSHIMLNPFTSFGTLHWIVELTDRNGRTFSYTTSDVRVMQNGNYIINFTHPHRGRVNLNYSRGSLFLQGAGAQQSFRHRPGT